MVEKSFLKNLKKTSYKSKKISQLVSEGKNLTNLENRIMKQVMMAKFDSPKRRKVDEYKVANPFVDVGFRQVKDVVDLRV